MLRKRQSLPPHFLGWLYIYWEFGRYKTRKVRSSVVSDIRAFYHWGDVAVIVSSGQVIECHVQLVFALPNLHQWHDKFRNIIDFWCLIVKVHKELQEPSVTLVSSSTDPTPPMTTQNLLPHTLLCLCICPNLGIWLEIWYPGQCKDKGPDKNSPHTRFHSVKSSCYCKNIHLCYRTSSHTLFSVHPLKSPSEDWGNHQNRWICVSAEGEDREKSHCTGGRSSS